MKTELPRVLVWALTLQNVSVTAVVAWTLAVSVVADGITGEAAIATDSMPAAMISPALGFVGIPTMMAEPGSYEAISGSAAIIPASGSPPEVPGD